MSPERHALHDELNARDEEALWDWPARSGTARAEELARICEQLAAILPDAKTDDTPWLGIASDPVECTKLNYIYGATLLTLAERDDPQRLPDAVELLGRALALARLHVPERVVTIKTQLYRAEHSLVMRKQRSDTRVPETL